MCLAAPPAIGHPYTAAKERAVAHLKSARSVGVVATPAEIGSFTASSNKFYNFCKKNDRSEAGCRKNEAKTSGSSSDPVPSNPNRGKTCSYCREKGRECFSKRS
eukprot:6163378-Alexandrium_andersonii.AAC.1